jgi:hypothetical protein
MNLIKVYESILKFIGLDSTKDGYVNARYGDNVKPFNINGLRVVLPLPEQLRSFDPKEKIIFHPLAENVLRGESDVINKLKEVIILRVNLVTGLIIQSLLNLVASPELHSKLTPEQAELLLTMKDVEPKTVIEFTNLMLSNIKNQDNSQFFNLYLKKGGTFKGSKFSRVGVVTFPYYDKLLENEKDLKPTRSKDRKALLAIFKFIFPCIEEKESYNYGSNSNIAPYLDTLLKTTANVASRLNDVVSIYQDFIDDYDTLIFDADWVDYFLDLDVLLPEIRRIPVQVGNDGKISINEESKPESQAFYKQPQQQAVVNVQQPVQQQTVVHKTDRGVDLAEWRRANQIHQPPPAYNVTNQNTLPRWAMQQGYPNQGYYPNQPPQQMNYFQQPQQGYNPYQQPYPQQGYPQQQGNVGPAWLPSSTTI